MANSRAERENGIKKSGGSRTAATLPHDHLVKRKANRAAHRFLQRRALLRNEKSAHIGSLRFQQLYLFVNSAGVPCQAAVCADNAVAESPDLCR